MVSNTNYVEIFVRLLDEGTSVFRPTLAVPLENGLFRLLPVDNYDPEDEIWEFIPGTVVRGQLSQLDGASVLVAVTAELP